MSIVLAALMAGTPVGAIPVGIPLYADIVSGETPKQFSARTGRPKWWYKTTLTEQCHAEVWPVTRWLGDGYSTMDAGNDPIIAVELKSGGTTHDECGEMVLASLQAKYGEPAYYRMPRYMNGEVTDTMWVLPDVTIQFFEVLPTVGFYKGSGKWRWKVVYAYRKDDVETTDKI